MSRNDQQLHETLARIAELAARALKDGERIDDDEDRHAGHTREDTPGCVVKSLPKRLLEKAAETARRINPVNAPGFGPMAEVGDGLHIAEPLRIAAETSKYWGPTPRTLTVSFMESTPSDLKARIISHMNTWSESCCIEFAGTNGTGDVRISRGPGGYYSYLGTDILHIPKNLQTMNLEGFTMKTLESEYKRVVRHEAGHTLAFQHEHMRVELVNLVDPAKAYKWFWEQYRWDKATVDSQVLMPLEKKSLINGPVDQTSIMCYQLPGAITKNGKPIIGGTDINQTDYAFAGKIYPKPGYFAATRFAATQEGTWLESEDVEVPT